MIHLNASALPRVLACLGSTQFPKTQEVEQSEAAREGDAAHHAAECALKGVPIPDVAPNGYAIDAEMREHAQAYADRMPPLAARTGNFWVEERGDFLLTERIKVNVRGDLAWLEGDTLHIWDFKYGWRIVEAEDNSQLLAEAIGFARKYGQQFQRVVMRIYQPRPYHPEGPVRTWELTFAEMVDKHDWLVSTLNLLHDPKYANKLDTGEHCEHCPGGVLGMCPAYLAATGNAIDVAMRGGPMEPSAAAMSRELVTLDRAAKVLKQRKDWLEDIAKRGLKAGQVFPGWAIEQQRGNTTWTIDAAELKKLTNLDVEQPPKLVTPAEAKRRGVSEEVIAANTTRPIIGDKLVRRDPDAYVRKKVGKKPPKKKDAAE